jgi:hypothetical protein
MFIMTTSLSMTGDRTGLLRLRDRGRIISGVTGDRLPLPQQAAPFDSSTSARPEADGLETETAPLPPPCSPDEKCRDSIRISSAVGAVGRWFSRS